MSRRIHVPCLALFAALVVSSVSGCRSQGTSFHTGGPFRQLSLTFEHMGEHRSSGRRLAETAELFRRGEHSSGIAEAFEHGAAGTGGLLEATRDLFDIIGPYDGEELAETFWHFRN